MFNIQIPGLPEVKKGEIDVLLTLSGMFGPIMLALVVGFIMDSIMRTGEGYISGRLTNAKEEDYRDHLVVIGWNEATKVAVQEVLEALSEDKYKEKLKGVVVVIPPDLDHDKVKLYMDTIIAHVKRSVGKKRVLDKWLLIKGDINSIYTLDRANLCEARGVIISMNTDDRTLNALLSVVTYITNNECKRPPGKEFIIAVEVLEDENENNFNAVSRFAIKDKSNIKNIKIFIVLSRSYAGRLLASVLSEPLSVYITMDLITFRQGNLDLTSGKWSMLKNSQEEFEKIEPVFVNKSGDWIIVTDESMLSDEDYVIAIRKFKHTIGASERYFRNKHSIAQFNALRTPNTPGHYVVVGFTEATESMIRELKRKQLYSRILLEEFHAINRSIIVVSKKDIFEELADAHNEFLDTVVHVVGDPAKKGSLKKAGILSSAAVIISMDTDEKTVNTTLQTMYFINKALESRQKKLSKAVALWRPLIAVETKDREAKEWLLSAGTADFAIASRDLAGQLMAYIILDSDVFEAVRDIISSTEGKFDIRQIPLSEVIDVDKVKSITVKEIQQKIENYKDKKMKILAIAESEDKFKLKIYRLPPQDLVIRPSNNIDLIVLSASTKLLE